MDAQSRPASAGQPGTPGDTAAGAAEDPGSRPKAPVETGRPARPPAPLNGAAAVAGATTKTGADPKATAGTDDPAPLPEGALTKALRRARRLIAARGAGGAADDDPVAAILNGAPADTPAAREERLLLQNVMKLRDIRVEDIMVPRADVEAVEMTATLDEVLDAFRNGAHSRLPVYRETLDDPIGVVHLKDLALARGFGARVNDFSLADHVRSVLAVPPSMKIRALLTRMQASRRHMALVIDEYGGVDGLVTIEDIIEQIVGAIEDEHDDAEGPLWTRQPDGAYLAEARAYAEDFQEATGARLLVDDWEEDVDTLGGLVFVLSGRVPERGEVIAHPLGHEFEIVDADPRRIKRLRVRLAEPAGDAEGGDEAGGAKERAEDAAA